MELERYLVVIAISDEIIEKRGFMGINAGDVSLEVRKYTKEDDNNVLCRRQLGCDLEPNTYISSYKLKVINRNHFMCYDDSLALVYELIIPRNETESFEIKFIKNLNLWSIRGSALLHNVTFDIKETSMGFLLDWYIKDGGVIFSFGNKSMSIYDVDAKKEIDSFPIDVKCVSAVERYLGSRFWINSLYEKLCLFDVETREIVSSFKTSMFVSFTMMPGNDCYEPVLCTKNPYRIYNFYTTPSITGEHKYENIEYDGNNIIFRDYDDCIMKRIYNSGMMNFSNYTVLYPDVEIKKKCKIFIIPLLDVHFERDISLLIFNFICTTNYEYPTWLKISGPVIYT